MTDKTYDTTLSAEDFMEIMASEDPFNTVQDKMMNIYRKAGATLEDALDTFAAHWWAAE